MKKIIFPSLILAFLLAFLSLTSMVYTVDAGETAIVTRYGEIVDQNTSGLNWKSPIEDVTFFSTREQKQEWGKFDDKGDVIEGLAAYTSDRQTALVALSLSYQISDPELIYKKYRTTENMINILVAPKVRQQLEIVFSKYNSQTVIERREEFALTLRKSIADIFKDYPLTINDVQSVFNFSKEYEKRMEESINKDVEIRNTERQTKIVAEKEKAKRIEAENAAAMKLIEAKALADSKKLAADAEAHAIKVKGQAEADSAEALADALSKNKELVSLKAVEKWQGNFPNYLPQGAILPINLPGIQTNLSNSNNSK